MVEQININTCIVSELNKQNINLESLNKIISKFVTKLRKDRILFEDILTFIEKLRL